MHIMAKGDKEPGSEAGSGEVTNGFWSCRDISDIVPLYTARSLYLKPIAKVNVSVSLPQLKTPGKTISTWDVMEKIRHLIRPDEFGSLKVVKNTLEFIRLEGDVRDRSRLGQVLARLDSQCLKLEGFPSTLKVRAVETKDDFPTRHSWDSYFRDAKHMNELKAGERPDTIHIAGLPVKWFAEGESNVPSEALIKKVFGKWGTLRRVDVPAADPYRTRMRLGQNIQKFSFEDGLFFDAYVQYIEYMDFVRAMDALRGMKLLKKEEKNYLTAAIKVDFDKTKHMSDNSVSHRAFERKRLIAQDNLAAEKIRKRDELESKRREELKKKEEAESAAKDSRRKQREEKRKRNALTVFRKQEEDKVSMKIAREERKLIKAQRQLESIRLLDELFDRIKIKIEKKEIDIDTKKEPEKKQNDAKDSKSADEKSDDKKEKKSKKKKLKKKRKRNKKDKESNANSSKESDDETKKKKLKSVTGKAVQNSETSVDPAASLPYPAIYPRFGPQPWYYDAALPMIYPSGRGFPRENRYRGLRSRNRKWRNDTPRNANSLNSSFFYNKQYYKYFASLTGQDYNAYDNFDRDSRSPSRRLSKSRSRSRSLTRRNRRRNRRRSSSPRNRSRSRSRRRSRSRSTSHRNRSRSRSRSRGKSRSRSSRRSRSRNRKSRTDKSRTKSRSKSRSRSRSRSKSRSRTKPRSRSKSRSRVRSKPRSRSRSGSRSRSKVRSKPRSKSRSRSKLRAKSRSKSKTRGNKSPSNLKVTRAKSKTPVKRKSRSRSWSLPKTPEKRRSCSWSKSVDEKS